MTDTTTAGYDFLAGELVKRDAEIERQRQHIAELEDLHCFKGLRAEVERLRTQCGGNCRYWEGRWRDEAKDNDRLRALLREARQYVSDAGNDEDGETQRLSAALLAAIDAVLKEPTP